MLFAFAKNKGSDVDFFSLSLECLYPKFQGLLVSFTEHAGLSEQVGNTEDRSRPKKGLLNLNLPFRVL